MSVLWRVLCTTILLLCGSLLNETKAATFDVIGTLDLSGQSLTFGSSAALNFEIEGPISTPINVPYSLSISLLGAPSTTSTTTNIVPFISATANANVNGATASVNTSNCSVGCGLFHPLSGSAFTISDAQRALSIALSASFFTLGSGQLPADDVITVDYTLNLGLPQGLSAAATPLPDSIWLFVTGLAGLAWVVWRRRGLQTSTSTALRY
jgi:hypothetical protein